MLKKIISALNIGILLLTISACNVEISNPEAGVPDSEASDPSIASDTSDTEDIGDTGDESSEDELKAGDQQTFTVESIDFKMNFVPGVLTFPSGANDTAYKTIDHNYWMAETEVSFELYNTVYNWAITDSGSGTRADGGVIYTFGLLGNSGGRGGYDDGEQHNNIVYETGHEKHPVTMVSWRFAMAWCNALTEYYNANNGTEPDLSLVYLQSDGGEPIRMVSDSYDSNAYEDDPFVVETANGFRLPTSLEWELAARYIGDANGDGDISDDGEYYRGWFASGADARYNESPTADHDGDGDLESVDDVAWYRDNSEGSTHEVGLKSPNALGLFDMSGNVYEWTFDFYSSGPLRLLRGSSWIDYQNNVLISSNTNNYPYSSFNIFGFRPCRTAE